MEDTIIKLVNKLAELSPQLWEILLRQVYVEVWAYIIWSILLVIVFIAMVHLLKISIKKCNGDKYSDWIAGKITAYVIGASCLLIFFGFVTSAVMRLYNPEFYAIQFLIGQIK